MKNILLLLLMAGTTVYGQNKLAIPDTISGTQFNLNLQQGTVQFYGGKISQTLGVNGNILGPTLIMKQNDFVDISVNNNLEETTTIHWHGMHVSAANDGGPHTTIAPGTTWNPKFTVLDRAGTYWYHPHLHEFTNKHVSLGIAGFVLVRDDDEAALDLPRKYGIDDFPLVVQTKDFDSNNQIVVPSNNDDVLLVNATIDPFLEVPAQVVRFRLLNGSSQRVFRFGLSDNRIFNQIASDGGLLSKPVPLSRLQLAPGERAEILVDFSGIDGQSLKLMSYAAELPSGIYGAQQPGMSPMMTLNGYSPNAMNGTNFEILDFRVVAQTSNPVKTIPGELVDVTPLLESSSDITRDLSFTPAQMGPNQLNGNFLINGQHFVKEVINFSIPLDNIEVWTLTNQSGIAHPFHIHDIQFYILDRNGVAPPENERGRKDVVLVKPQETVRFITQFTDFANDPVPYMLHCHMLTHEDDGMMLQFEVVGPTTRVNEIDKNSNEISIYPNPLNENNPTLTVTGVENGSTKVMLYNLRGQKVFEQQEQVTNKQLIVDLQSAKQGTFVIKIVGDEQVYSKKIVVF